MTTGIRSPDTLGAVSEAADDKSPIVLTLRLRQGDAVSGSVASGPELEPIAFHGWVELMSAINSLRSPSGS